MDKIIKHPRMDPSQVLYQAVKRILDLMLCVLILPAVLPILIICGIAIHLDSDGPIFFIQDRIGKGGRSFRMIKFRTMEYNFDDSYSRAYMKSYIRGSQDCNGDQNGTFKPTKVNYITRVGRVLRKTSLDELPQIVNVLKGEMSIVGPRPNVPWEVEEYRPWHHERFEVLPGITGLAQVRGRSNIDFLSLVRYDIEYVEKRSLMLDLKILWWTFTSVLAGKGAR